MELKNIIYGKYLGCLFDTHIPELNQFLRLMIWATIAIDKRNVSHLMLIIALRPEHQRFFV